MHSTNHFQHFDILHDIFHTISEYPEISLLHQWTEITKRPPNDQNTSKKMETLFFGFYEVYTL